MIFEPVQGAGCDRVGVMIIEPVIGFAMIVPWTSGTTCRGYTEAPRAIIHGSIATADVT
jgi:hypothetical protein